MSLDILNWNVLAGFADADRREVIMETVDETHWPGLVVFQEAYKERQAAEGMVPFDDIRQEFDTRGYVVEHTPYDDADQARPDRNALLVAVRRELVGPDKLIQVARLAGDSALGGRNVIMGSFADPDTGNLQTYLGGHLDDTSAAHRRPQVDTLLRWQPDLLALDANDRYPGAPMSAPLYAARAVGALVRAGLFPNTPPTGERMRSTPGRIGNQLFRMDEMRGDGTQRLLDAGYVDVDRSHSPTFPARRPIAQLDRVLAHSQSYQPVAAAIGPFVPGFDHRAIHARVRSR